nr:hypothetical protein BaRGS_026613 [Batillaria attramentaria]
MKRWVQVLLFVLLLGMLMQCALYYNSHYPQLVLPSPQTAFTSTVDPARHSNATAEVDPCPYPFQINQPDACARATELVIVVVTAVKNFEDRQAVRETWAAKKVRLFWLEDIYITGLCARKAGTARTDVVSHLISSQPQLIISARN